MRNSKYTARLDNIYFLSRVGSTLRWATQDVAREKFAVDIKHVLARLDRLEARVNATPPQPDNDPA